MTTKLKFANFYSFEKEVNFTFYQTEQLAYFSSEAVKKVLDGLYLSPYGGQKQALRLLALHFNDYTQAYATAYRTHLKLKDIERRRAELLRQYKQVETAEPLQFVDPLDISKARYNASKYNAKLTTYQLEVELRRKKLKDIRKQFLALLQNTDTELKILNDLHNTGLDIDEDIAKLESYVKECSEIDYDSYDEALRTVNEHNSKAFNYLEKQRIEIDLRDLQEEQDREEIPLLEMCAEVEGFSLKGSNIEIDIGRPICVEDSYEPCFFEAALRKKYVFSLDKFDKEQEEYLDTLSEKYQVELKLVTVKKAIKRVPER